MGNLVAPVQRNGVTDDQHRELYQFYGLLAGLPDWGAPVDLITYDSDTRPAVVIRNLGTGGALDLLNSAGSVHTLLATDAVISIGVNLAVAGNAAINGTLSAGATSVTTLTTTGNASIGGNLGVAGNASINGTLGAGATTVTTLHATGAVTFDSTLSAGATTVTTLHATGAATIDGNVVVGGSTQLGVDDADGTTVISSLLVRNLANTAAPLAADAGNARVVMGSVSGTPMGADTTPAAQVKGRLYVAPESANDHAIQWRRSIVATTGWWLGEASDGRTTVKDKTDSSVLNIGQAADTYQLEVVGDLHTTDDAVIAGDVSADRGVFGGTTFSGVEKVRIVGESRLEGSMTVTTGGINVTGSSVFANGGTVTTGGWTVTAGGVTLTAAPLSIGANVATAGSIRLANAGSAYGRNQANNADIRLIDVDTSNIVNVGDGTNTNLVLVDAANGGQLRDSGTSVLTWVTGTTTVTGNLAVTGTITGTFGGGGSPTFTSVTTTGAVTVGNLLTVSAGGAAITGGIVSSAVSGTPAANTLYTNNIINFRSKVTISAGTPSVAGSYNYNGSLTDNGVGDFTVGIDRDFADTTYAITSMGTDGVFVGLTTQAVGSIRTQSRDANNATSDGSPVMLIACGLQ